MFLPRKFASEASENKQQKISSEASSEHRANKNKYSMQAVGWPVNHNAIRRGQGSATELPLHAWHPLH